MLRKRRITELPPPIITDEWLKRLHLRSKDVMGEYDSLPRTERDRQKEESE